jgi:hypothetical protein
LFSICNFILNSYFYDKLIRIEYERFPLEWTKDRKPIGSFFVPPDSSLFWGSISRNRTYHRWLFSKPSWVRRDEDAEKFYKYYRITGLLSLTLILMFILSFIVIFLMQ